MAEQKVTYDVHDGVGTITLNRAAVLNAIDLELIEQRGEIDERFYRAIARATNWLEDMPKLTIAVLHSWSIGGGLQLASACDLRLAADDAVLEFGATRHGLVPDATVLRIARLIGLGRAKALALLNERVSPQQALDWGLVSWVTPADRLEASLQAMIDEAFHASRTAVAET